MSRLQIKAEFILSANARGCARARIHLRGCTCRLCGDVKSTSPLRYGKPVRNASFEQTPERGINTTVTRLWCPHLSLYESVSEGIRAPQVHFKFKSNPQILEQVQPCEPQHVQVSLVAMCFSKHWFPEQKEGAAVVTE